MIKVSVTGGAGFTGSNLVKALVDKHEVTVLDNLHTGSMGQSSVDTRGCKNLQGLCNDCSDLELEQEIIIPSGYSLLIAHVQEEPLPSERGDKRHGGHNGAGSSEGHEEGSIRLLVISVIKLHYLRFKREQIA